MAKIKALYLAKENEKNTCILCSGKFETGQPMFLIGPDNSNSGKWYCHDCAEDKFSYFFNEDGTIEEGVAQKLDLKGYLPVLRKDLKKTVKDSLKKEFKSIDNNNKTHSNYFREILKTQEILEKHIKEAEDNLTTHTNTGNQAIINNNQENSKEIINILEAKHSNLETKQSSLDSKVSGLEKNVETLLKETRESRRLFESLLKGLNITPDPGLNRD